MLLIDEIFNKDGSLKQSRKRYHVKMKFFLREKAMKQLAYRKAIYYGIISGPEEARAKGGYLEILREVE